MPITTIQALFSYVDTLLFQAKQSNRDSLSEDELFDVGIKHKQLPRNERNWDLLAKYVHWECESTLAGESFRNFVKYRQHMSNILDTEFDNAPSVTTKSIIDDNPYFAEDFKEATKVRDIYNDYKKCLRNTARIEAFMHELRSVAQLTPSVKLLPKKDFTDAVANREAILMLSDLHLGEEFKNFYNSYNKDIAIQRISLLASYVCDYCTTLGVNTLHVVNLGDLISGVIHPTLRIQNQLDVISQVIEAANILSEFLNILQSNIPEVTYRSCTDNHSRLNADIKQNIECENFQRLIDVIVKEKLSGFPIYFAEDNLDPSIISFRLRNGQLIMAAHGHLEKPEKAIDNFSGAIKALPDYVLLSHYHASRVKSYNGARLLINGSIVGTDEFALSHRLFNPPEQTLIVFDGTNSITCNIRLDQQEI